MTKKITIFEFNNSQKTYDNGKIAHKVALRNFSLQVRDGERLAIIGPSGCGKSTILRIIAGLDTPDNPSTFAINKQKISFVFQDPTLMPWSTVFDNIYMPLRLQGVSRQQAGAKIAAILKKLYLKNCAHLYPHQLSGGMKMRVSIGRALITSPKILLLDEPFASLDEITRFRLNDLLLELHLAKKFTLVLVTHSIFESVYLSQRVAIMGHSPGTIGKEIVFDKRPQNYRTSKLYGENCALLAKQLKNVMSRDATK